MGSGASFVGLLWVWNAVLKGQELDWTRCTMPSLLAAGCALLSTLLLLLLLRKVVTFSIFAVGAAAGVVGALSLRSFLYAENPARCVVLRRARGSSVQSWSRVIRSRRWSTTPTSQPSLSASPPPPGLPAASSPSASSVRSCSSRRAALAGASVANTVSIWCILATASTQRTTNHPSQVRLRRRCLRPCVPPP